MGISNVTPMQMHPDPIDEISTLSAQLERALRKKAELLKKIEDLEQEHAQLLETSIITEEEQINV